MSDAFTRLRADAEAREAFKSDPQGWLARHGMTLPEGRRVMVHENTETELHVVLPPLMSAAELSSADLELVAGGKGPAGAVFARAWLLP